MGFPSDKISLPLNKNYNYTSKKLKTKKISYLVIFIYLFKAHWLGPKITQKNMVVKFFQFYFILCT
jgi:hypothetical protein